MNPIHSNDLRKLQHQIYRLVKLYQCCDRVCLTSRGVGASQGYTLLSIPREGSLSMQNLSTVMGLASSTTTRIVDQLVRKGLVRRKSDRADRRVVKVELTVHGQELWQTLDRELQEFFKNAFTEIQEEERARIIQALEQITQTMEKALEGSGAC